MAFINRGDNTGAFGNDFLRIYLNNPNHLYIQKAVFQVNGQLEKEFWEPQFPLRINFTGEETQMLHQVNQCKLALWDEHGRRRTADGKFTFFVKENKIRDLDMPDPYINENPIPDITFDLSEAEFVAQFTVNATPTKLSELEEDINLMKQDNIVAGRNVEIIKDGDDVIINADIIGQTSYNDLRDKPSINGQTLEGDVVIDLPQIQSDWNQTNMSAKSYIKNKPTISEVGKTGDYNDLLNRPTIPNKTSDLQNDNQFITADYTYNKQEIDSLVQHDIDLQPVYDRMDEIEETHLTDINDLRNELTETINDEVDALEQADDNIQTFITNKVDIINTQLEQKATKQELEEVTGYIQNTISREDLNDALELKVDVTSLGNGILTISQNNEVKGTFAANAKNDKTINLNVPTKLSQLIDDSNFIKTTDIDLSSLITLDDLNNRLQDKLDASSLGTGILTIQINGENKGSFNANESNNKIIDLQVPTKVSNLTQDILYLKQEDLDDVNDAIEEIQISLNAFPDQISALQTEVDRKVDFSNTKSMVDNAEINRLRNIDNYDDTEIKEQIQSIQEVVDNIDYDISNKVDKIEGKGLSSNDFTDSLKNQIEVNQAVSENNAQNIRTLRTEVNELNEIVPEMQNDVQGLQTGLSDESLQRAQKDQDLQDQVDILKDKSYVIDIVTNKEALNNYDTTNVEENDVIIVINDETHQNTVCYYRYQKDPIEGDYSWVFKHTEGEKYSKVESDERFVSKELTVNNKALTNDITLNYQDVHALSEDTQIGMGQVVIQVNEEDVGNFYLNDIQNNVINIEVPTSLSELSNTETMYVSKDTLIQSWLGNPTVEGGDAYIEDGELKWNTLIWDKLYNLQDKIKKNADDIETLSGNLPEVVLTGSYDDLLDLPTKISDLKNHNASVDTTAYIDNTFINELVNKADLLTNQSFDDTLVNYALKTDIPTALSQLENDRGYVTVNALGKGNLNIKLNDESLGIFNANSKDDLVIEIPIDDTLSDSSLNPVQNKTIKQQLDLKAIDANVVHKTGNENIQGNKTFIDLFTTTKANTDNSTAVATTEFVKNQGYAVDSNVMHLSDTETITGNKTFTGSVNLSEATTVTQNSADNSTKLATTAFVKNQGYALDNQVVHDGTNETINGNKTFAETTTFNGITYLLGQVTHVTTPDGTINDAVVNVEYITSQGFLTQHQDITGKANLSEMSSVALSGDYDDLLNKPTIPAAQIQSDWNQTDSNSLDFIKNKPSIPSVPTNISAFNNDAGYLTQHQDLSNYYTKGEVDQIIQGLINRIETLEQRQT